MLLGHMDYEKEVEKGKGKVRLVENSASHVIVCGHTRCGAAKAALKKKSEPGDKPVGQLIEDWISVFRDTARALTDGDVKKLVVANVGQGVEKLATLAYSKIYMHEQLVAANL